MAFIAYNCYCIDRIILLRLETVAVGNAETKTLGAVICVVFMQLLLYVVAFKQCDLT